MLSMKSRPVQQSGIVMISAVLILLVIGTVSTVYMLQAREQLADARGMQHKIRNCQAARQTFDSIIYELLTRDREELNGQPAALVSGDENDSGFWNYYEKPFTYHGVEVRLQDMAGLIGVGELFMQNGRQLMRGIGIDDETVRIFSNSLRDWEDEDDLHRLDGAERTWYREQGRSGPRNAPIASVGELRLVRGYPQALDEWIDKGWLILVSQHYFNPTTAPRKLLGAFLKNAQLAEQIHAMRQEAPLTRTQFLSLTGIRESEELLITPALDIRVTVTAASQYARCTQRLVLGIRGDNADPYYTLRAVP